MLLPAAAMVSRSYSPVLPEVGVEPVLVAAIRLAQRCGDFSTKLLTLLLVGSGNTPPAHLLTTSTICLMVVTISFQTSIGAPQK